ncbi:NACHT domain-containing protein [Streptomyces chartreusis]|uniref:NACHT domain-containing protein n=1 Tax=Streptomyces chartreusis TaxID=1969 RepID=UPI003806D6E1
MRYLLLMAAGVTGAVALAWRFGLGTAATAAALLPTLAPAYLTWKAFQHDRTEAAAVNLPEALEQVAQAVKRQWDGEARIRRVHDPSPLPVAWRAADAALFESWPLLGELARRWPGGPPGDASRWPADAAGLAGADADIGDVFVQRVPTQRLVVLGEPGAGKSVLLIRLLQELLAQRRDGGLIPVLFSLASWDPVQQPLTAWLADQLRRSIPTLAAPAPQQVGSGAADLAQLLTEEWRILPLLDGFDELPPALHAVALDALNRALPARQPLVLASRAAAYQAALARPDVSVRLNGAAGIHLLPLTGPQTADYLLRDAGGPHTPAAHRWRTVVEQLGTDAPVGQALSTPLGVFLARTIYNPRPQASPSALPDPDELCDRRAFPTHTALVAHLFNAFIPAAYSAPDTGPSRWSPDQAHRTFVFLANFLQTHRGGSPDLAWWEVHLAVPARSRRLVLGLGAGLSSGLASGLVFGLLFSGPAGVATGLATGVVTGYTAGGRRPPTAPSTRLRWSAGMFGRRLLSGLAAGMPLGLLLGLVLGLVFHYVGALPAGLLIGLMVSLALGLVGGLVTEKPDLATATGPAALLRSDRHTFRVSSLVGGLAFGLGFGIWAALATGLVAGFGRGLAVGLVAGPVVGLAGGIVAGLETAWSHFAVANIYLSARREVPSDLMSFLADAHEHRGVLRQVGAVYQFRHIDLQRHLTTGSQHLGSVPTVID